MADEEREFTHLRKSAAFFLHSSVRYVNLLHGGVSEVLAYLPSLESMCMHSSAQILQGIRKMDYFIRLCSQCTTKTQFEKVSKMKTKYLRQGRQKSCDLCNFYS